MSSQKGFGAVEVLLIIVIVGILGFVGYRAYVTYTTDHDADPGQDSYKFKEDNTAQDDNTKDETSDTQSGHLAFTEWDLKLKMPDASKVTYTYSAKAGNEFYIGKYDSSVSVTVKHEYLQDKSCDDIGVSMYRGKNKPDRISRKIGSSYYWVAGGPGNCSDDPDNNPDDILLNKIRTSFTETNLETL